MRVSSNHRPTPSGRERCHTIRPVNPTIPAINPASPAIDTSTPVPRLTGSAES